MSWYWWVVIVGCAVAPVWVLTWTVVADCYPNLYYAFTLGHRWLLWTEGRVFTRWEVRGNDIHKGWSIVWVSGRTLGRRRAMTKAQEWAICLGNRVSLTLSNQTMRERIMDTITEHISVRILDSLSESPGNHATTVDACRSTSDGLAYYLRTRNIDPEATEASVAQASELGSIVVGAPERSEVETRVACVQRHPITNAVEREIVAEVER